MPTLDGSITGFVTGDHLSLRRTIDRDGGGVADEVLPAGVTISTAWLTIKEAAADLDADALVQKEITTIAVDGTGHIEDDGTGDTDPVLRFDLIPADTVAIGMSDRYYDVQVLTSSDRLYTPEVGTIAATASQVTQASS